MVVHFIYVLHYTELYYMRTLIRMNAEHRPDRKLVLLLSILNFPHLVSRVNNHIWIIFIAGLFTLSSTQASTEIIFEMDGGKTKVLAKGNNNNWCKKAFTAEVRLSFWPFKIKDELAFKNLSERVRDEGLTHCETFKMLSLDIITNGIKQAKITFNYDSREPITVMQYTPESIINADPSNHDNMIRHLMTAFTLQEKFEAAKTEQEKKQIEDKMKEQLKRAKANYSGRYVTTPDTHKISISMDKNCITKVESGHLDFDFCNIGGKTHFDFIENETGSNQFLIRFNRDNSTQCMSATDKGKVTLESCENASLWSLFRLSELGYEIHLLETGQCLSHYLELKLITCWNISSDRHREQLFKLQTNRGEYNNTLGHTLVEKDEELPRVYSDPYYELRALEDEVYDKSVVADALYMTANIHVQRLKKGESFYTIKAVDSALIVAYRLAVRGEFEYAAALAQSIESIVEKWVDRSKIDDARYRRMPWYAEFLAFGKALMRIYTLANRYDLAISWANLQLNYPATGVNAIPQFSTPIKPTTDFIELALQHLNNSDALDEKQLEAYIWRTLDMPLDQRKDAKIRQTVLMNMPTRWDRTYGHQSAPYLSLSPIFNQNVENLFQNTQYYARVFMYLGYLYSRWAKMDPSYLNDAKLLLDNSLMLLSEYPDSYPYWMGRLYTYLVYWAKVAKKPEKQEKFSKIGLEILKNIDAIPSISDLRFQFYSAQIELYGTQKAYKKSANVAQNILTEFNQNINSLNVRNPRIQQLITRYRKLLKQSLDVQYMHYQKANIEERNTILNDSLLLAQRMRFSKASAASQQLRTRLMDVSSNINGVSLVRDFQDAEKKLKELNNTILKDPFIEPSNIILTQHRQASEQYFLLKTQIQQKQPNFAVIAAPHAYKLPALQNSIFEGQAVLLYRLEGDSAYVWALTRHEAHWWRIQAKPSEINRWVQELRVSLKETFNESLAEKLYNTVMSPVDSFFKQQSPPIETLIIEADGNLQNIPFSLFLNSANGSTKQWLGERYALVTIPQVAMLMLPKHEKISQDDLIKPLYFGMADPSNLKTTLEFSQSNPPIEVVDPVLRSIRATDLCRLTALPNTRIEVEALAKALNVSSDNLLMGTAATEHALRELNLEKYRILHFATHAILSSSPQKESGLVMTPNCPMPLTVTSQDDGLLSISEIANLKLSADSVLLSACNTAGANQAGGEALSGLAQAFLYAGAKSLVVSHWPVDSVATRTLMIRFSELWLLDGMSRSTALQKAMIEIQQQNPQWRHPYYWAPFVVVGAQLD